MIRGYIRNRLLLALLLTAVISGCAAMSVPLYDAESAITMLDTRVNNIRQHARIDTQLDLIIDREAIAKYDNLRSAFYTAMELALVSGDQAAFDLNLARVKKYLELMEELLDRHIMVKKIRGLEL